MKKVNFRCPEDLVDKAEEVAKALTRLEGEEVSLSDVYRRALRLYLKYQEDAPEALTFVVEE